jgi:thiamine pyrophosphate-dependent acetolactate synthase large subunit-like protein
MANQQSAKLGRRDAVKRLLADRGDLLVITSLGGPSNDVAAATGQPPLDYYLGGAMGASAMMGLGLARAQPKRRVAVFTGDGEMLMAFGSLATIGADAPQNLVVVAIDNEQYAETGMQRTHTGRGVDLADAAAACSFAATFTARSEVDLVKAASMLHEEKGPVFIVLKVEGEALPPVKRIRDGTLLKGRFRQALLGHF